MNRFSCITTALSLLFATAALAADPLGQWHWRNPLPTANAIGGLTFANGQFMAVDDGGEILSSPDGLNWTIGTCGQVCDLLGIGFGNGAYVAVGGTPSPNSEAIIFTSPDGAAWTDQAQVAPLAPVGPLLNVCYGDGSFVAVGYGYESPEIVRSTDGVNWTAEAADLTQQFNFTQLSEIAYGNGTFVAVGSALSPKDQPTPILSSPDGVNWTAIDSGVESPYLSGVSFLNGMFVAVGVDMNVDSREEIAVLTSGDGSNWTNHSVALDGGVTFTAICYGAGSYVAVGIGQGGTGIIFASPDAKTWTKADAGQVGSLWTAAYGNGVFVASTGSELLTSTNGTNWTSLGSGVSTDLGNVLYYKGGFLAVGDAGAVLRSTDGVRWTAGATGASNYLESIASGGGILVAVGDRGTIITSTNSLDWIPRSSVVSTDIEDVCYGNGIFAAVAMDGSILTSSNGAQWAVQNAVIGGPLGAIAFGHGTFVAVGWNGTSPVALASADGLTWASSSPPGLSLDGVGYGDGMFVAGGTGTIFTSVDGLNWTPANFNINTNQELYRVCYAHGTFVIVGQDGAILTSTNGTDWITRYSGAGQSLTGVAFGDQTFVTVGAGGTILQSDPLPPLGLSLSPAGWLADGSFSLNAAGPAGQTWEIDTSTDLVDWTWLAQSWSTNSTMPFIDPAAPAYGRRFYRGQRW
jgi:hypothetical protein